MLNLVLSLKLSRWSDASDQIVRDLVADYFFHVWLKESPSIKSDLMVSFVELTNIFSQQALYTYD